jgi:cellulose synthase/poly-beta-1,6-N-acetylglucosamine synthase-like glycosyltransferase
MPNHGLSEKASPKKYDYFAFSRLSGNFARLPRKAYKVQYRPLMTRKQTFWSFMLTIANIGIELGFLIWLFQPKHISFDDKSTGVIAGMVAILAGIIIIETFRLINMVTLCIAALVAREPIPVRPQPGLRVAFTTAIVPSKEPFEIVEKTLKEAKKIRYKGTIDVWLLDEGNDPDIKKACEELGVHHFSRKGIEKYNAPSGGWKAKTKHGNHNGWLDAHGHNYDIVLSVDLDHVPNRAFAERIMGYFRDPDVAFVVGPQVYGNFDNTVTKGSESQAYLFQAAIQRAGNFYESAMFVGTNHAYRVKTWEQIGGFQDSITEDMFTSLRVHGTHNPQTGNLWKSVYTPDVIAVGEGPSSWTDFFSQQLRWARGSNEILLKDFVGLVRHLPWKSRFHYSLMISYFPTVALSWILGIFISMLYLVMGQTGIDISGGIWLALYTDILVAQILLYAWFRKYNVSPHEEPGTLGFPGMFFSMLAAPIYVTALVSTVLRNQAKFVVTPKGDATSPDSLRTFSKHFLWATVIGSFFIISLITGNSFPGVKIWSILTLAVCLSPVAIWIVTDWEFHRARLAHIFSSKPITESEEFVK